MDSVCAEEGGSAIERVLNAVNLYLNSIVFVGMSIARVMIDKSGFLNFLD